jgi:cytochrome c oxidase assembly protein subunit 15
MTPVKNVWLDRITAPARIRLFVWLSLATQILIVVTGGLVRLTGSGLGCPTWPKCTDDSLVSTAEMGIHGIIEFGNRLLTFVLLIVAALTFITLFRLHPGKKSLKPIIVAFFAFVLLFVGALVLAVRAIDALSIAALTLSGLGILGMAAIFVYRAKQIERIGVLVPSFGLGFGIILQAVVGGITVLTELNSWIVGLHFVISSYLIALASVLVYRALPKASYGSPSPLATKLAWPVVVVGAITILVGVVVTGAGPHAGDAATPRNGLDLELWQHFHSYPGYLMAALIFLQLASQIRHQAGLWQPLVNRSLVILLAATLLQAVIGVVQARLGVPPFLVAAHMLGAAVLSSLLTFQYLMTRQRA